MKVYIIENWGHDTGFLGEKSPEEFIEEFNQLRPDLVEKSERGNASDWLYGFIDFLKVSPNFTYVGVKYVDGI